jgi:Fe-S oxidoreductase
MATHNEKDTTRARANILREFLTHSGKMNRYDHREIYEVMDLCLSCKACKSECPSNVDMAKLKAEFLQHYYDTNGVPFRSWLIANFTASARLGSVMPGLYNFFTGNRFTGRLIKRLSGFHRDRSMPELAKQTLRKWYKKHPLPASGRTVYLFCDEFTNYNDAEIGKTAVLLLERLGYRVLIPEHLESARTWLSKGLVRKAQSIIRENIRLLAPLISAETPLLGVEPSAILTFRDEYPDLAAEEQLPDARKLAACSFMIEEFLAAEAEKGHIDLGLFTKEAKEIELHGHCQQKAVASVNSSAKMLSIPANYSVRLIPSGCCGMAGSFGYEKEHYEVSQQIGELVLFPKVRSLPDATLVAAPGTSCRHQIKDGTGRTAMHPVEILYQALA